MARTYSKQTLHLDISTTAWLAGLLEGEGTFTLYKAKQPRVGLEMTDKDVVTKYADLLGVKVSHKPSKNPLHKDSYQTWVLKSQVIADLLHQILPYMGERRSIKIRELLANLLDRGITPSIVSN